MATPKKKWPHAANWCREDCIALAMRGNRVLVEIVEQVDNPIVLRSLVKAIDCFRQIEINLKAVGYTAEKNEIH